MNETLDKNHNSEEWWDTVKKLLSIGEVKMLMRTLNTSKATSTEDFPTWVSKEAIEDVSIPLHDIINRSLDTGTFPDMWKRAQVVPVPKTKTPTI